MIYRPHLTFKQFTRVIHELYLRYWKYRNVDPAVCCCGELIGRGGSICYHGGCRSMLDYTIAKELKDE